MKFLQKTQNGGNLSSSLSVVLRILISGSNLFWAAESRLKVEASGVLVQVVAAIFKLEVLNVSVDTSSVVYLFPKEL